jgi:NADH:ubiquinone oxidoreductase subunit H
MRGLLPRIRYDELIALCWKIILPFILNYIIFIMGFKFLFFNLI